MTDREQSDPDLVAQLFVLMTARGEDAAALAAEGQSDRLSSEERRSLAQKLGEAGRELSIIAEAAIALLKK